jgi:hypothetical protein
VIASGWRKSGVHPFHPELVLSQLDSKESFLSSIESDSEPELATSRRAVRRLINGIYQGPQKVSSDVERLIKRMEILILQDELLQHANKHLNSALVTEKKAQKESKPLGLLGEDDPKFSQFWSSCKVALRIEEIKTKQRQEEPEKQQ